MTARNPKLIIPVNKEIIDNGTHVFTTSGAAEDVEEWVKKIARESQQPVEWCYFGGRACLFTTGDTTKVLDTINEQNGLDEYGCVPEFYK